jgi:hypothetical protein
MQSTTYMHLLQSFCCASSISLLALVEKAFLDGSNLEYRDITISAKTTSCKDRIDTPNAHRGEFTMVTIVESLGAAGTITRRTWFLAENWSLQ